VKSYGQEFSDDEIISIMWRSIPPEWTVNLLALGKEPWKFRDLNDQLANYRQQWQSDQQKQIMNKMASKLPRKLSDGKRKSNECRNHNSGGGRSGGRQGNNGRGGRGRGLGGGGVENSDNNDHLKMSCVTIVKIWVITQLVVVRRGKMEMKNPIWFQKRILKIYFNLL
jgi:hypothetical protein